MSLGWFRVGGWCGCGWVGGQEGWIDANSISNPLSRDQTHIVCRPFCSMHGLCDTL